MIFLISISRNEGSTTDIDVLARIYDELQRTALDLQFELDELSEGREERQCIENILKAIHETTKSLAEMMPESQVLHLKTFYLL